MKELLVQVAVRQLEILINGEISDSSLRTENPRRDWSVMSKRCS